MVVHLLSNVRAVVGGRIVEAASVASEDGRILSIEENRSYSGAIDGRGAFCLPGLVDSHCDALEREVSPRPTVSFDLEFALRSLEARFLGAGITTACHGVNFFGEGDRMRSPEMATRLVDVIAARRAVGARIDHRVLFRIPARTADAVDRAIECLPGGQPEGDVPLVSFEDHTPGQGQYRSVDQYKAAISEAERVRIGDVDAEIARRIAEAEALLPVREANLARIRALAAAGSARVLAHDCVDAGEVVEARRWGAAVAEFPCTVEAARAALDQQMPVVLGAPNVLLGGSHSGNASAEELIALGYCTGLASDYAPSTLLAAAFDLARRGVVEFTAAVALITSGPAEAVGLDDHGRLAPGCVADLVLVEQDGRWPRVVCVLASPCGQDGQQDVPRQFTELAIAQGALLRPPAGANFSTRADPPIIFSFRGVLQAFGGYFSLSCLIVIF
jgi:alpha-D-ribose 1-methylphosphonate 5-triphosphate diphosphatase